MVYMVGFLLILRFKRSIPTGPCCSPGSIETNDHLQLGQGTDEKLPPRQARLSHSARFDQGREEPAAGSRAFHFAEGRVPYGTSLNPSRSSVMGQKKQR